MTDANVVLRVDNAYLEVMPGHTGLTFTYQGKGYLCIGFGNEANLTRYARMARQSGHTILVSPFYLMPVKASEGLSVVERPSRVERCSEGNMGVNISCPGINLSDFWATDPYQF